MTVLLTARAVAERLDVAPATILRWARQGDLPSIRLPSGAVRFRESDVEGRLVEWSSVGSGAVVGVLSAVPRISEEE